ncbi:MAG: ribonuclease H-like domain-containing protein [Myxococcales bacterium]|nr:ribonuclease H-like domain-containing protein [Myxococcales bacterium]
MIVRTFQHIPGVGPWREKDLWARGIETWDDFPPVGSGAVLSAKQDDAARARIAEAREALAERDLRRLAALIPQREHWRLYPAFASEAVFFDIEADGGPGSQEPTVVSLFDEAGLRVFIEGRNLRELPAALAERPLWVTFNGGCYDIPVLQRRFARFPAPAAHVDLRFLCRKVRLPGGLKRVEEKVGLSRPPHLKGVNGWDAVLLWRAYKQLGDIEALRFLVEYNLYDSINLRALLELAYNRAVEELACRVPALPVFTRGDVLYDVSKLILSLGPTRRDLGVLRRVRKGALQAV